MHLSLGTMVADSSKGWEPGITKAGSTLVVGGRMLVDPSTDPISIATRPPVEKVQTLEYRLDPNNPADALEIAQHKKDMASWLTPPAGPLPETLAPISSGETDWLAIVPWAIVAVLLFLMVKGDKS